MKEIIYKSDCREYLGHIPCKPHKEYGVHCDNCQYYDKLEGRILIIKLGAIGDVIRTTPLLHKLKEVYPNHEIWWLTYTPDIVPSLVDRIYNYDIESIEVIKQTKFDVLINLDKDTQAGAIANITQAENKFGFTLENGKPAPINELARHKFLTGLFDDLNKENTKSYPEEIFEICGFKFNNEEYILESESYNWNLDSYGAKIIGLNTGCGARWTSRLWSDENWIKLIIKLIKNNYYPILLGGKQEHEKNLMFEEKTGAKYLGYFPLKKFISLVNQTDAVVSAVTMGMHIAIGLKKPLILMNNIFNPKEFELYGRGEIIQPSKECKCYFSAKCRNDEYFCMDHLSVEQIFDAILRALK